MKKIKLLFTILLTLILCGCLGKDSMDGIDIRTTAYPIEYITTRLYGEHSTISSIYPNDMDKDYIVSDKLLKDYSETGLFIFNGKDENENNYKSAMQDNNHQLKIINSTESLTYNNGMEELWLDPLNLLTIANNVKKGFQEYTSITYLLDDIEKNYATLKVELIQLDANYRDTANRANNKKLIVGDDLLLYLEKYGLEVISIENNEKLTQKTLHDAEKLVKDGTIKTIYIPKGSPSNPNIDKLQKDYKVEVVELDTLYTLSEQDRKDNNDYFTIMYNNLELLKQQLYN